MKSLKLRALALCLVGATLAGCAADDESIVELDLPDAQRELFARYVSLGNSITAGFQSGGINDSTQLRSYPNLVAQQAGAPFELPLLQDPGCPPPFLAPLGIGGRVGGPNAPGCSLRQTVTRPIQNFAVPGARLIDAVDQFADPDPTSGFNRLQTIFLGGRSQLQAARQANPTLVSAWLGNNEVLGAALTGSTARVPTEAQFAASLDSLVRGLKAIPTLRGGILLGAVNANFVPLLQPGAYFFLSGTRDAAGVLRFNGKPVNANCAPSATNPNAFNLVSFQILAEPAFPEINCADDAYPMGDPRRGALVLSLAEQQLVAQRTAAYNAAIRQRAEANNFAYVDPNVLLATLANERNAQGLYQNLRKCQALRAALQTGNPSAVQAAIVTSCPVPPAGATASFAAPNFFGALISFDGFHPSTLAHRHIANLVIGALNTQYGLSVPTLGIS